MPVLTRLFARTSLVYLVAALVTGLLLALRNVIDLPPLVDALAPVYFHLLMLGWIAQLIFGIVYWMFPKYSRERPHGNERLAWAVYWLLNAGLLLRVAAEPLTTLFGGVWGWALVASALLQWLAGMAFVINTWGRVKER
jgi:cbb3-type cytochrome oxidase subunit 1